MRESVKAAEALFFIMLGGRLRSVVEGKVEVMKCVELIQMLPQRRMDRWTCKGSVAEFTAGKYVSAANRVGKVPFKRHETLHHSSYSVIN